AFFQAILMKSPEIHAELAKLPPFYKAIQQYHDNQDVPMRPLRAYLEEIRLKSPVENIRRTQSWLVGQHDVQEALISSLMHPSPNFPKTRLILREEVVDLGVPSMLEPKQADNWGLIPLSFGA